MSEASNPKGIDVDAVSQWLGEHIDGATPPYEFELIAAGGSNLTYRVRDASGHVWALRRPPVAARLATAHDMSREWKIMSALDRNSSIPVPRMLGYCDDTDQFDAHFYVMSFVEGTIIRDSRSIAALSAEQCRAATDDLIDVQAAFHKLDVDAIGLGDLAKTRDGYVARQLSRWSRQVEAGKTRELPLLDQLHERLGKHIPPESRRPALAHGDYRFDNTVIDAQCRIAAVLDWELCTLGDPTADFVWSLLYWAQPGDKLSWLLDAPTLSDKFPNRDYVVQRYEQAIGQPVEHLDFYMAFSWWKQACIVEGVYSRLLKGASGGMKVDSLDAVAQRVEDYLAQANALAEQAGI